MKTISLFILQTFFFFQFISSFYLCIFWWGELQILTKLNLFVCLFSAFHLGPVEKSFSTQTFSSSIFMVSPFAQAERSLGGGGEGGLEEERPPGHGRRCVEEWEWGTQRKSGRWMRLGFCTIRSDCL